jgi:hypothetical protein
MVRQPVQHSGCLRSLTWKHESDAHVSRSFRRIEFSGHDAAKALGRALFVSKGTAGVSACVVLGEENSPRLLEQAETPVLPWLSDHFMVANFAPFGSAVNLCLS